MSLFKADRTLFMAKSGEAAQRLRSSFVGLFSSSLFSSGTENGQSGERDCLTQGDVPDIFVVLTRENGSTIKVDAER